MFDPLGVERPQGAEPKNKTICLWQMVLFLVRAWGLEPQRITAREPKGDVTLVKGLKPPECFISRSFQAHPDKMLCFQGLYGF